MSSAAKILGLTLSLCVPPALQAGSDPVPAQKQTLLGLYLSAKQAYAFVSRRPERVLLLDIRSFEEVNFLGMPTVADANIPFEILSPYRQWDETRHRFKMQANPRFVTDVARALSQKGLDQGSPIILLCRSGHRSARAANLLAILGYNQVYTVVDGYEGDKAQSGPHQSERVVNGWKNAGLPWSDRLDRAKMYRVDVQISAPFAQPSPAIDSQALDVLAGITTER
jgi:rhodanese-related sulfurtransferase